MTLKSMTGYGKAIVVQEGARFVVEILSVNRKHLDINIVLPKYLTRLDPEIRKIIAAKVFRGHLTIRVSATFEKLGFLQVLPNFALAKQLYQGWHDIGKELGESNQHSFNLSLLQQEPELFSYNENEALRETYESLLKNCLNQALEEFIQMRMREGLVLQQDIINRANSLKETIEKIEQRSSHAVEKYRTKLLERLKEFLPNIENTDERLLKEIALFAERIDIVEEITRFKSHLVQFERLMTSSQEANGKAIEFLLQELFREINTIGSKTADLEVSYFVVDVKSELERIREQIQNIE